MQVESIAECSRGAFCNTFDLHYAIIGLEKTNNFFVFLLSGLLRQVLQLTIKFQWVSNLRNKKMKKFHTDQPIPVRQGLVRGNKNIFKVGLKLFFFANPSFVTT